MSKRSKALFDPLIFLAKVGEGKTISKYRKDQIVFSQREVADAVFYIQQGKVKLTVVSFERKAPRPASPSPCKLPPCKFRQGRHAAADHRAVHADVVQITSDPAFRPKNYVERAIEYGVNTPEEFARFIVQSRAEAAQLAKESDAQPQ